MADILPYTFDGIQNIKLLQNYKSILIDHIKREKNKLKVFNLRMIAINKQKEITDKQIDRIVKKNKKHKLYFCRICARGFKNDRELCNHNCTGVSNAYPWSCTPMLLRELTVKNHNSKLDLKRIQESYKEVSNNQYYLTTKLERLRITIKTLSVKCQYCKQSNKYLEKCGCDFNHLLCESCCEDVNDKCPICLQIINFEMCPICMNYKTDQIDVNCGNKHKICQECLDNILNKSFRPRCPFCRIRLSS